VGSVAGGSQDGRTTAGRGRRYLSVPSHESGWLHAARARRGARRRFRRRADPFEVIEMSKNGHEMDSCRREGRDVGLFTSRRGRIGQALSDGGSEHAHVQEAPLPIRLELERTGLLGAIAVVPGAGIELLIRRCYHGFGTTWIFRMSFLGISGPEK